MSTGYWVENHGVRIHYLQSSSRSAGKTSTPVLFIPGAMGYAELYQDEFAFLAPRPCVAISLRGRGQSDTPERDYSFEDQVSDIEAVVKATNYVSLCLVGFSMGAPLALGYAIHHPYRVEGLVVVDYPARYPAIPEQWVKNILTNFGDKVHAQAVEAIQSESREVFLWEDLNKITCPMLILRGHKEGAVLDAGQARRYLEHLPQAQVIVFEEAGHELWEPDYDRFMNTLEEFFLIVDAI